MWMPEDVYIEEKRSFVVAARVHGQKMVGGTIVAEAIIDCFDIWAVVVVIYPSQTT